MFSIQQKYFKKCTPLNGITQNHGYDFGPERKKRMVWLSYYDCGKAMV